MIIYVSVKNLIFKKILKMHDAIQGKLTLGFMFDRDLCLYFMLTAVPCPCACLKLV